MRFVSVLNSITRRKPSSVVGIGIAARPSASTGDLERHVVLQRHELARDARLLGELDQLLAALGLLDLAGARQQRIEIAVFVDQLGRRLDADARHARHVVGRIAGQRLHVDDLVGRHAELLDHLVAADRLGLHGVEHDDAGAHQLHQVLVGRDDGHVAAGVDRMSWHRWRSGRRPRSRSSSMQATLKAFTASRMSGNCGTSSSGGGGPVRLVVRVDLVAEGLPTASKMTARCVGASDALVSRSSFHSMAQKPCTAPTGSPSDGRVSGGSAWKARKM